MRSSFPTFCFVLFFLSPLYVYIFFSLLFFFLPTHLFCWCFIFPRRFAQARLSRAPSADLRTLPAPGPRAVGARRRLRRGDRREQH